MTATGPQTAPPAKVMFDAMDNENFLTCEMGDKLLVLCGIDLDKPGEWPVGDVTFDPYDSSFEFKGVTPGFTITREQWASCAALGFSRCWICYTDGTERYVSSGFLAEGLKAGHRGPSLDNDKRELARERAARVEAERQRDEAVSALAREREARAQMKGWFRVYGEHAPFCATNGRINVACDCGYEYAEEKVNKLAALPAPAKGAAE